MVIRDFEQGGFPINKRCPVLCFTEQGKLYVAYDRLSLKMVIESAPLKKCVGVWPGKHNTDCFPLNPEYYRVAPPEEHRSIDNAVSIKVFYGVGQIYKYMEYMVENNNGERTEVKTSDVGLLQYITKVGLKFTSVYGE